MKFDIEKKGYKKSEVDEYVFALKNEYESKLAEQKNRIFQLRNELTEREKQLAAFKSKTDLISTAILNAVQKADEIEKLAAARYRDEMQQLRAFHDKWQTHYNKMLEKYPDDEGLKAIEKFNAAMDDILSGGSAAMKEIEKQFDSEKNRVENVAAAPAPAQEQPKPADKPAVNKTLAEDAVSKSGFSFEEAWNPKDDLSEIMKDLGLLGGDE